MAETLIADVIDPLLALLAPDPQLRDTTAARPFLYVPLTNYLWPQGPDEHRQHGDGRQDEERFQLVGAYTVVDAGERDAKEKLRAVSVALDTRAHEIAAVVRANRVGPVVAGTHRRWGDLGMTINHNDIVRSGANAVRGFTYTLRGWRMVGP